MKKLQSKRFISRLAHSPLTYAILIIFAALFVYSAFGAYHKSRLAKKRVVASQEELASLSVQKEKLSLELDNANTTFGQEKAIREKFNVVREGEKVIMVVKEAPVMEVSEDKKGDGFWKFLRGIFTKD